MHLSVTIPGIPAPQGSKRHVGNGILIESSKRLKPWRADAIAAIHDAQVEHNQAQYTCPVHIIVIFRFPRPKSHFNKSGLKPSAPFPHVTRPDLDKLLRALLDAMTQSGIIRDDSQVHHIEALKVYAERGETALCIRKTP